MTVRPLASCGVALLTALASCSVAAAQGRVQPPVLQLQPDDAFGGPLSYDRGVVGMRQRLLELLTTASVMQVTAHPDDEQSGLLTYLARGTGARVSLLTLNRGEGGANAIGSEQFDALGLLRGEELALAGRYYGIDDQYFTSAADFGYSRALGEAARSWDTTAVLRDMVRVIRANQPLVVIARWHGSARDGHGQHQLAGALVPLAVEAAADSARFPELLREGLEPWRVRRLFRSNLPSGDRADVAIDVGRYDPWLGESPASIGAEGISRQRSQTSGRRATTLGASIQRLQLVRGMPVHDDTSLFAGLPTSAAELLVLGGAQEVPTATSALVAFERACRTALSKLDGDAPWTAVSALVDARRALERAARATDGRSNATELLLSVKKRQLDRAMAAAIGLQASAIIGDPRRDGRPLVPGERVAVQLLVGQGSPLAVRVERAALVVPDEWIVAPPSIAGGVVRSSEPWRGELALEIPAHAEPERPVFARRSIAENHYAWTMQRSAPLAALRATHPNAIRVRFTIVLDGESVVVERMVRLRRSIEPNGFDHPRAVVVPPISLRARPAVRVTREGGGVRVFVNVDATAHGGAGVDAEVSLASDDGSTRAGAQRVSLSPGERKALRFEVTLASGRDSLVLVASARVNGREWRDELTVIDHPELEPSYLYATPAARVRRIPVSVAAGVKVGYVMGVGDLVPEAIEQLGAEVTLVDAETLSSGDLARFDVVMIGTRAYAVRPELAAATPALVRFARSGGAVVVLYQTQEFKPETMAPYPAALPDDADEVTEEDSPVAFLVPDHPLMVGPNRLTSDDFDGWIEQRGSKFLSQLAPEYVPLVEMHDTDRAPQRGVWVTASVGAGRWSYVALALHRQLPYGVPGAYRILANLLTPRSR